MEDVMKLPPLAFFNYGSSNSHKSRTFVQTQAKLPLKDDCIYFTDPSDQNFDNDNGVYAV